MIMIEYFKGVPKCINLMAKLRILFLFILVIARHHKTVPYLSFVRTKLCRWHSTLLLFAVHTLYICFTQPL